MVLNYLEFKDKQYCCCFAKDITERRQAEEALRKSEQKYRDIFEKSISGLFKSTPDGRLIEANDAFAQMYGYNGAAEMLAAGLNLGKDLYANPEDRTEMLRILAKNGKVGNYESRHLKKDKTPFWVAITARTIRDTEGTILFYEGGFIDITERRLAEEALRESETRYRSLFEGVPIGLYRTTPSGEILDINPALVRLLGYPDSRSLLAINVSDLYVNAGDRPQWLALTDREGTVRDFEVQFRRYDGTIIWVKDTSEAVRDDQGRVLYYNGNVEDITERKMAEEALRESEGRLALALNVSQIGTWDLDLLHHTAWRSPRHDQIFGYDSRLAEWSYEMFLNHVLPEDRAEVHRRFNDAVSGKHDWECECRIQRNDGEIRWIWANGRILYSDTGEPVRMLGLVHDVTERKRAEEALQEKTRHHLEVSSDSLQRTEADLRIYQTELEVQNEELRRAQVDLERSRERYFELYDLAPAGYCTISDKGLILTANLTAATMLGVERGQLVRKPLSRFIVRQDQDIFYRCRKDLVESGERQSCELGLLHSSGSSFRVHIIAVPAPPVEGDGAAISLMVVNISTISTAKKALQTNEWDFHHLFNNHASVMLLIDPATGKIINANRAAEHFYGRSSDELCTLSMDAINILPPEEMALKRKMAANDEVTVFTLRHRLLNGKIRDVEVHSSPVVMGNKTVLFSIIHDITDRLSGKNSTANNPSGDVRSDMAASKSQEYTAGDGA
jgi:PAS domain S-box-containing protein